MQQNLFLNTMGKLSQFSDSLFIIYTLKNIQYLFVFMFYDRFLFFLNIRRGVKCNYRFTPGGRNYTNYRFVRHLCLTLAVRTNIVRIIFGVYSIILNIQNMVTLVFHLSLAPFQFLQRP